MARIRGVRYGRRLSARKRSWEAEQGEHAVVESGHSADSVAADGEDVQAGPVADAGAGAQVGAESRLTIGPRRYKVESAARAEEACEEARRDLSALVFEG